MKELYDFVKEVNIKRKEEDKKFDSILEKFLELPSSKKLIEDKIVLDKEELEGFLFDFVYRTDTEDHKFETVEEFIMNWKNITFNEDDLSPKP